MKETIIFIDDEKTSRMIYSDTLQEIYGDEYSVIAIEPRETIGEMLQHLEQHENIVSIVIDEKLHVEVGTNYKGSQLVEAIRILDSKLPLYILTSEIGLIEPPFGSVEYIIDKSKIELDEYKKQCSLLMRRHINSFIEIKSVRSKRFDELLRKSVAVDLSADEQDEFDKLDFLRVRQALSTEALISSEELTRQEKLLEEIKSQLKTLGRE